MIWIFVIQPLVATLSGSSFSANMIPGDLAHRTLLHLDNRQDWSKWLDAAGVRNADLSQGRVFDQASGGIDAAVDGQGVALARTALAAWDLLCGRLVRPFPFALPVTYAHWIVCPKATAKLPKIVTFRDWLLAEAAADATRLREALSVMLDSRRA